MLELNFRLAFHPPPKQHFHTLGDEINKNDKMILEDNYRRLAFINNISKLKAFEEEKVNGFYEQ